MANEIRIQLSMRIAKGNLLYQPPAITFTANLAGTKGPTPGSLTITTDGVDIPLSELNTMGGIARIVNIDPDNFITVGIKDMTTEAFYPLVELLPGEGYPLRLSRFLGDELGTGSGSGTVGSNSVLHAKADTADCDAIFDIFDA